MDSLLNQQKSDRLGLLKLIEKLNVVQFYNFLIFY